MNKFHPLDLDQLKRRKHSKSDVKHIESYLFTKYFPKYQKNLKLENQNRAIKSKIKRTKIIRSFEASGDLLNRSYWRVLLASSMKNVIALENTSRSSKQFADQLKYFSGLKCVRIFRFDKSLDQRGAFFISKACRNMGYIKNLEHLEVDPISIETNQYFSRLNSHRKLLGSLKTLKFYFDWKDVSDGEVSELIEKNKNLLKNVTSLKLNTLHSPFHIESFQRLGQFCPKISTLSFESHFPWPIAQEGSSLSYLQTLNAFQNMRYLKLHITDVFSFLKDLVLPSSVQSLVFTFDESLSRWIMRKIDNTFDDSSEEEELSKIFNQNPLLIRFYEVFKDLENLEALALFSRLDSDAEEYKYQSFLSRSLLKRICSPLKNLKILPTAFPQITHYSALYIKYYKLRREDPYLPQLIESCEGFAPTLETLELGSEYITFSKFDLSGSWKKFTNLSEIKIEARLLLNPEILSNLISLGESIKRIKFCAYIRANALLPLLKQMNQVQKLKQLKVELELHPIRLNSIEGISITELEKLSKTECVFLKLCYGSDISNEIKTFYELYKEKFGVMIKK